MRLESASDLPPKQGTFLPPRTDAIRQPSGTSRTKNPSTFSSRIHIEASAISRLKHCTYDGAEEVEPLQVGAKAPA